MHVTLYWESLVPLAEEYSAVVQLIDDAHQLWGGALQRPTNTMTFYPPTAWRVGELVRDDYDVNLNPSTPAGTYLLHVSLFTSADAVVPASFEGGQGDSVPLGNVRIMSP